MDDLIGVMNMIIAPLVLHKLDEIFPIALLNVVYSDFCAASAKAKWVSLRQQKSVSKAVLDCDKEHYCSS